jgi:Rap1a immunity proteins
MVRQMAYAALDRRYWEEGMTRWMCGTTALMAILIGSAGIGARATPVSRDDFQVGTTANLLSLCGATETDPLYTAARNFCHGYTVATYRAIVKEQMASRATQKLFCLPSNTTPTRDQAIADFVRWASARPETLSSSPTDGIAEYLAAQYPCP